MFELASELLARLEAPVDGTAPARLAVVTVTHVLGSAPRALGSSMAVDDTGRVIGSISGGCVESQAYALAEELLATGLTATDHFGFDDDAAFAAGLTCGGQMRVFGTTISASDSAVVAQLRAAAAGRAAGLALVIAGPDELVGRVVTDAGTAPSDPVGRRILVDLRARIASGVSAATEADCDGETLEVLHLVHATPPRLIVFGAVDFSGALADAGGLLGYRVTVCDARPVFATPERFPGAAEVVVAWPHRYLEAESAAGRLDGRTAIAVLTHDEKFDVPVLSTALALARDGRVGYVGAMGSRRTHDRRLVLLHDAGVAVDELELLHSPIGLDIGASTPQETAVSIVAEIVRARNSASGRPLAGRTGPIHAGRPTSAWVPEEAAEVL